ncbi:carbohydrate ABC transporter substrate-binding protein, CUT1 family [Amycolatopsis marina]|uniref:Carbohydrate ABC transporter substrate-binding protein, CUT1 family n=1 Tax=Amycolatopsis marina TaxID=490629 RepID=A0A1I0WN06_9PSEU|nr:extracellular solute-binding protein [Amycolatopsis marina]SFA89588.1 carbohydrate ABC transporter substrate-binding protein, CUT1 family [Amycolatopsis marina]
MRVRRSKRVVLTALFAGTALAVAGCGTAGGGEDGGQNLKLVVAQYTEDTKPYWDGLIEKFENEHPGASIDLQVIDWGNLQSQVNTMIQTQQIPDILNINLFADYAESDLLYRADELMSPEQLEDFLPTFAENASYNGEQYAFPFVGTVNGLYYNKTIFAEAGIEKPPATWEEFLTAAEKIKALPGDYVPYALALGTEGGHYEFGTWARSNGGGWMTGEDWTINDPRNVETLEFLKTLTNRGFTQANPGQTNRADGTWPLFAQGKAAMVYGSFGTRAFMEPVRKAGIDFGISTHPTQHGAEPATHGVQDYLMAFRKDGNQQLVSDFLAYFYQPGNYVEYLRTEGLLPTTSSAAEQFAQDPETAEFVDLIPQARFDPTSEPVWAQLSGTMGSQLGTGVNSDAQPRKLLTSFQDIAEAAN